MVDAGPVPLDVLLAEHGAAVERAVRRRGGPGPTKAAAFARVAFEPGPHPALTPRVRLLQAVLGAPASDDATSHAAADGFAHLRLDHQEALWHGFVEGEPSHVGASKLPLVDLRAAVVAAANEPITDPQLRAALVAGLLGDAGVRYLEPGLVERARAVARPPQGAGRAERIGWWIVVVGVVAHLAGLVLTATALLLG